MADDLKLDTPEDVLALMGNRLHVFAGRNPVKKPCKDCPFVMAAQGNDYLAPGRLDGIKMAVLFGQPFHCHKTVYQKGIEPEVNEETGEEKIPDYHRKYQVCAGALEWATAYLKEKGGTALINGVPPDEKTKDG